jgi:isopenicillin-N N-acyltransferase-like protein
MLVHESGELYNVEVSARRFAILYGEDGCLVHTNHFLDGGMREVEYEPDELISTRVRYFRALRLTREIELHSVNTLQAIQKDHINFPDAICNHVVKEDKPLDREKTIMALVIDLAARQMHACWGNPCEAMYSTYQLSD